MPGTGEPSLNDMQTWINIGAVFRVNFGNRTNSPFWRSRLKVWLVFADLWFAQMASALTKLSKHYIMCFPDDTTTQKDYALATLVGKFQRHGRILASVQTWTLACWTFRHTEWWTQQVPSDFLDAKTVWYMAFKCVAKLFHQVHLPPVKPSNVWCFMIRSRDGKPQQHHRYLQCNCNFRRYHLPSHMRQLVEKMGSPPDEPIIMWFHIDLAYTKPFNIDHVSRRPKPWNILRTNDICCGNS